MKPLHKCYETLGIGPDESLERARQAYRDLVKVWHPDRFTEDPRLRKNAEDKLKEINEAYDQIVLSAQQQTAVSLGNDQTSAAATPPTYTYKTGIEKVAYGLTLLLLSAAVIAIWVYVAGLAIASGELWPWLMVSAGGVLLFFCVYLLGRIWEWIDIRIFLPLEARAQTLRATIDVHLPRLESKARLALLRLGIQVQRLRADQRQLTLVIALFVVIGTAVYSPEVLYRYDEDSVKILRTNRVTGTETVRFKSKEYNAAVIATIMQDKGLGIEVNVGRDGGRWIVVEEYANLVERRRIRKELEAIRNEVRQHH